MKPGFTCLLATLGLLAGLSLPAGYYRLAPGADGTVVVDGMTFLDRALADQVLAARNLDYDFRHSNGTKPRQAVVAGYSHLLELDAADTPAAKARRAVYAMRLGEVYCWWRDETKDSYGDYAKAIDWWHKARAWAQPDQEYVFWVASAGLVNANLNQGRRIAAFLETAETMALPSPKEPTGKGYRQTRADRAKAGPPDALLHCGKLLSPGVALVALHRVARHPDHIVSDSVAGLRAKAPASSRYVNPLELPAPAFEAEGPWNPTPATPRGAPQ